MGLEVKGRRTGRPHTLAVVVAGHQGQQYLVSMLGECEWVNSCGPKAKFISSAVGGTR